MSVPAWKRSGSRLDVFYEAVKLRHIITQMIMRNFGLKTGKYKHLVTRKMKENYPDLKRFFDKVEAYQENVEATGELKKYETWMLNKVRSNLFMYSSELVEKIAKANEIKCTELFEYRERILLEDQAISAVAAIKQEVNFVEEFFEIDLNKYMNYSEQLEKVKNYLYKWKKSIVNEYLDKVKETQKNK